jgi:hypothetical protein
VASLEGDKLVVFYHLSEFEILPAMMGGLIRGGLLYLKDYSTIVFIYKNIYDHVLHISFSYPIRN